MMGAKLWAVVLVVFCTLLTSSAQILYKFGALRLPEIVTNVPLLVGIVLYAVAAVVLIVSFKGGDVTVLYPIIATSYVWVALLSYVFLGELLSVLKFFGILFIFSGICCIGFGSRSSDVMRVP
ncbi:hypothetical protein HY485_02915 [Candidatus Woesearchaeota archaeon]|nr:hypothetical protein [Candidatus Woesearchaeota archaeon]